MKPAHIVIAFAGAAVVIVGGLFVLHRVSPKSAPLGGSSPGSIYGGTAVGTSAVVMYPQIDTQGRITNPPVGGFSPGAILLAGRG